MKLAAICQLPIEWVNGNNWQPTSRIWLPFAGCLSTHSIGSNMPIRHFKTGCQSLPSGCNSPQTGELASGCRLPVSFLAFNCFKPSQIELASGCQLLQPVANSHRTGELASGCRLPPINFVVLNPLKSNWHLAASCQLPIHTKGELASGCRLPVSYWQAFIVLSLSNRIGIWLPVASCQFTQTGELASGCRLPVSYLAFIVLNPLKSNWHLAASCQLPIHTNRRISIWLPFAGFLSSFYCFKPSQSELASGCQLPVANSHKQAN